MASAGRGQAAARTSPVGSAAERASAEGDRRARRVAVESGRWGSERWSPWASFRDGPRWAAMGRDGPRWAASGPRDATRMVAPGEYKNRPETKKGQLRTPANPRCLCDDSLKRLCQKAGTCTVDASLSGAREVSPMRLLVQCPACRRQYDATQRQIGSQFRCHCGEVVTVQRPKGHEARVVRCSACGAARGDDNPDRCPYCQASFTLHERDLNTVCPHCLALVSDQARFCHHCGGGLAPELDAGGEIRSRLPGLSRPPLAPQPANRRGEVSRSSNAVRVPGSGSVMMPSAS